MRKENSSNQKIKTNQIFKDLKNLKFEEIIRKINTISETIL